MKTNNLKKPELLAPAGNLEKLKVAITYGADAVFIGGKEFSLRSFASNFTLDDIKEGVEFAHEHNAKVHVTCNIIPHNDELNDLKEYLINLDNIGVDAIIVADPYIMMTAKSLNLKLEVHVSTQLSVLNSESIKFFEELKMDRVVLGREVDYDSLKEIRDSTTLDLEYFIHGAMCINYSGRCMLSNYMSRRDANRGGCSQSCRWYYDIFEDGKQINNDDIIPFSMSSKDMCQANNITKLIDLGINSFKIEGRMKSLHYIATVVSAYRKIIDDYVDNNVDSSKKYHTELLKAANRPFCDGFFNQLPDDNYQLFNQRDEHPTQDFCIRVLGIDKDNHLIKVEQRNYFKKGDVVEFFSSKHDNITYTINEIYNEDKEIVEIANHPMEVLYLPFEEIVYIDDMARKVTK